MVPTGTFRTMLSPSRPVQLEPSPWRPRSPLYSGLKRKWTSVLWRSLDSITMSPPRPPSPPEGPPRGTNFSRRKAMQPLPPSPALIRMIASSINMLSILIVQAKDGIRRGGETLRKDGVNMLARFGYFFNYITATTSLPGPLVTDFVVLAVDCADPQQVEDGRPCAAFVLAFFFHADEAGCWLVLAIILNHGDGVALQCVASVAEGRCGCYQGFIAGDEIVLLAGGGVGKAAVAGDGDLVGSGAGGRCPYACNPFAHHGGLVRGAPVLEAQAVEEAGPEVVHQLAHTGADKRVFGNAGDHGQAAIEFGDEDEAHTGFRRAMRRNTSANHHVLPALPGNPVNDRVRHWRAAGRHVF